jgi:hypothetical protein
MGRIIRMAQEETREEFPPNFLPARALPQTTKKNHGDTPAAIAMGGKRLPGVSP